MDLDGLRRSGSESPIISPWEAVPAGLVVCMVCMEEIINAQFSFSVIAPLLTRILWMLGVDGLLCQSLLGDIWDVIFLVLES